MWIIYQDQSQTDVAIVSKRDMRLLIILSLKICEVRSYESCHHRNAKQIEHGKIITQRSCANQLRRLHPQIEYKIFKTIHKW
jgi:hypothetical protein